MSYSRIGGVIATEIFSEEEDAIRTKFILSVQHSTCAQKEECKKKDSMYETSCQFINLNKANVFLCVVHNALRFG